jgi:photosystem II PsbY protein
MDFDFRVLVVLLPVLLAGGWAVSKIGAVALVQIKAFLDRATKAAK